MQRRGRIALGRSCGPEMTRLFAVKVPRSHRLGLRWLRGAVMVHTHQGYEHYARERVRASDDTLPRPGFKSTAVYFEWLAQKETRDYDRRQRLSEVARFYRSLAGIIPAMPTWYKVVFTPN